MHLRVALTADVHGRARRLDQSAFDHRAAAQPQTLGAKEQVDGDQDSFCQLVLRQRSQSKAALLYRLNRLRQSGRRPARIRTIYADLPEEIVYDFNCQKNLLALSKP